MRVRFLRNGHALAPRAYFHEESLGFSEHRSSLIENASVGPMLSAFRMRDPCLDANRHDRGHRPEIIHFHVTCHCYHAMRPYRFAHGLIEQGGDNSAVHIALRSLKGVRYLGQTNDTAVLRKHEIEMEADGVGRPATKASILRSVRQRGQLFNCVLHWLSHMRPASTSAYISRSTLEPVSTTPIRFPVCLSLSAPASAAAPAPSAMVCVS